MQKYLENMKRYIFHGGQHCPVCGSDRILSTDEMYVTLNYAFDDITCSSCGAHWRDVYKLVGIKFLCSANGDENECYCEEEA